MLICSCAVISDHEIELALLDIMIGPDPPLPTPGVVWRYLERRMDCCGCAPLAVETIYAKLEMLVSKGLLEPDTCASMRRRLLRGGAGRMLGARTAEERSCGRQGGRCACRAEIQQTSGLPLDGEGGTVPDVDRK